MFTEISLSFFFTTTKSTTTYFWWCHYTHMYTPRSTMKDSSHRQRHTTNRMVKPRIDTSTGRTLRNNFELRGVRGFSYVKLEDMGRPMAKHKRVHQVQRQNSFNTPDMKKRAGSMVSTARIPPGRKRSRKKSTPRAIKLLDKAWKNHFNRQRFLRVEKKKKSHHVQKGNTLKENQPCGAGPSPSEAQSAK